MKERKVTATTLSVSKGFQNEILVDDKNSFSSCSNHANLYLQSNSKETT
jgi:hypothetical protein